MRVPARARDVAILARRSRRPGSMAHAGISQPILVDRFAPAPGRTISVYDRGAP